MLRDLGYRPYEGERLPASRNTWVLARHGLARAWGSWMVKIAAFTSWLPALIGSFGLAIVWMQMQSLPPGAEMPPFDSAPFLRGFLQWHMWLFMTTISIGAGAGAIAQDMTFKAFQFYFAKPVTAPQYLMSRVVAVTFWCFILTFPWALLLVGGLVGVAPEEERLTQAGLILPALICSLLMSGVMAVGSVSISSLSRSRALTISAWILLLFVPHVLGFIVAAIGDWPWLLLLSVPALIGVLCDAVMKIEPENALRWYHALPVLVAVVGGGLYMALHRIKRAEVIT